MGLARMAHPPATRPRPSRRATGRDDQHAGGACLPPLVGASAVQPSALGVVLSSCCPLVSTNPRAHSAEETSECVPDISQETGTSRETDAATGQECRPRNLRERRVSWTPRPRLSPERRLPPVISIAVMQAPFPGHNRARPRQKVALYPDLREPGLRHQAPRPCLPPKKEGIDLGRETGHQERATPAARHLCLHVVTRPRRRTARCGGFVVDDLVGHLGRMWEGHVRPGCRDRIVTEVLRQRLKQVPPRTPGRAPRRRSSVCALWRLAIHWHLPRRGRSPSMSTRGPASARSAAPDTPSHRTPTPAHRSRSGSGLRPKGPRVPCPPNCSVWVVHAG